MVQYLSEVWVVPAKGCGVGCVVQRWFLIVGCGSGDDNKVLVTAGDVKPAGVVSVVNKVFI
jgi:hypothetical protein